MEPTLRNMDMAELVTRMKGDRSYEQLAAASGGSPGRQRWQQLGRARIWARPSGCFWSVWRIC